MTKTDRRLDRLAQDVANPTHCTCPPLRFDWGRAIAKLAPGYTAPTTCDRCGRPLPPVPPLDWRAALGGGSHDDQ